MLLQELALSTPASVLTVAVRSLCCAFAVHERIHLSMYAVAVICEVPGLYVRPGEV